VLQCEVLVGKLFSSPNGSRACAIAVYKIAALDHKTFDDAMELAAFVALWLPSAVFRLSSAELAEILSRLWDYIFEQLHLDSTELLPS
jgi:hypothetical protein